MAPARLQAALLLGAVAVARAAFTCDPANSAAFCAALGTLYVNTNGTGWKNSSGWSSAAAGMATNLCTFAGVTCTSGAPVRLCAPGSVTCARLFSLATLQDAEQLHAGWHPPARIRGRPHHAHAAVRGAARLDRVRLPV